MHKATNVTAGTSTQL